jgi:hypothetical protein
MFPYIMREGGSDSNVSATLGQPMAVSGMPGDFVVAASTTRNFKFGVVLHDADLDPGTNTEYDWYKIGCKLRDADGNEVDATEIYVADVDDDTKDSARAGYMDFSVIEHSALTNIV